MIASAILLLAFFSLVALFALTGRWWQERWAPPDRGVNLVPRRPVLRESAVLPESAFDLFRRATEAQTRVPKPNGMQKEVAALNQSPWSEKAFPFLEKMFNESQEALALARRAVERKDPQVPTMLSLTDPIPQISSVLTLLNMFRVSAARRVAADDFAGAYQELETGLRFVQILSRGGVLIHALVEMAGEAQICAAMRAIVLQHDIPREVASKAIAELRTADATLEPLGETMREEYRLVPGAVVSVYARKGNFPIDFETDGETLAARRLLQGMAHYGGWIFGSDAKTTNANLARVYQEVVQISEEPYSVAKMRQLENLLGPELHGARWIAVRDPVGLYLAKLILPVLGPIFVRHHLRQTDLRATATMIALRQFQNNRGENPARLRDLTPTYLPEVPLDPFDGQELRYVNRGRGKSIIYSVGPNQLDEFGLETKRRPRTHTEEGDIIFCECETEPTAK